MNTLTEWSLNERLQVVSEVRRRAAVDADFRRLALTQPEMAIATVTPQPLPSDLTYRFVDNSGTLKTIPLPNLISEVAEPELLSDPDIEKVGQTNWEVASVWTRE